MSSSANILLLALALLKSPTSAEQLAKDEALKETRVHSILRDFLERGLVQEVDEGFLITEEGKKKAWDVAMEGSL